jgi:predicted nucleic acid-binding protein
MAAYFFDASGIVKRYLLEPGTAWVQGLTSQPAHEIFVARITLVEVTAAVTRRGRGGALSGAGGSAASILSQFRLDVAHQYNILEVTPALLGDAITLAETHGLRAYDAVQLAVARELHRRRLAIGMSGITLICADRELNGASTAEALTVEDPNHYP